MTLRTRLARAVLGLFAALGLAACAERPPLAMADIPVYPDAVAIQPDESALRKPFADQIAQNIARRANLSISAPYVEQLYSLPADASWEQVKAFYAERFTGDGWGRNGAASRQLDYSSATNAHFKAANWRRGGQDVMVVMLISPAEPRASELIVYLYTRE